MILKRKSPVVYFFKTSDITSYLQVEFILVQFLFLQAHVPTDPAFTVLTPTVTVLQPVVAAPRNTAKAKLFFW